LYVVKKILWFAYNLPQILQKIKCVIERCKLQEEGDDSIMIDDNEDEAMQTAADETSDNAEQTANDEELAWQLQVGLLDCIRIEMTNFAMFTAFCSYQYPAVKLDTVF